MPPASAKTSEDPALLTADLLLRIGFGMLAVAVPLTASFSRRAIFVLLPFGTVLIMLAATLASASDGRSRLRRAIVSPIGVAVLVLAFWGLLSLLWAPFPTDAAQRLFKLTGTLLLTAGGVAFLPSRMRISSVYLLPLGLAASAAVAFGMALVGFRVTASPETDAFTLERANITLSILVWPALAALLARGRWGNAAALGIGVVAAVGAAGNTLTLLGFAVGALAALAVRAAARPTGLALMAIVLILFMLAPPLPFLIEIVTDLFVSRPPDWLLPITTWQDIVAQDVPRLLTGHGLETVGHGVASGYLPPRTPRSILFQVWYELGLVGAFATAFCVARGMVLAAGAGAGTAPFLVGALATATTLAVFSENFEQIWWVCLLGVAAVCFAAVVNAQYRTARPRVRLTTDSPPPQRPAV